MTKDFCRNDGWHDPEHHQIYQYATGKLECEPCIFPTTVALSVIATSPSTAKGTSMEIIMIAGSRPTKEASSDWFTGTVWQDPIVEAPDPARASGR